MMRLLVLLSQLFEEGMLQNLRCCVALIRVVDKHFHDDILGICAHMRDQFLDANELLGLEIELHVSSMFLEMV